MKIKNIMRKIAAYGLLGLMFFLNSCQKDLDTFTPDPVPGNDIWYNDIPASAPVADLRTVLLLPPFIDSLDIVPGTLSLLNTGSGIKSLISYGTIVNGNNNPVSGRIAVETHLIRKKGEMIRMGITTASNNRLLVSAGRLSVRFLLNGNELGLAPQGQQTHYSVNFRSLPLSSPVNLFKADPNSLFNWLPDEDTSNHIYPNSQDSSYQIVTKRTGWTGVDYFFDTTGISRAKVTLTLPSAYTNANTMAFVVFNNMNAVVALSGNAVTRKFSSFLLPVNKPAMIIVVSKQGSAYYLGQSQVTIGGSGSVPLTTQDIEITPSATTIDEIRSLLDNL